MRKALLFAAFTAGLLTISLSGAPHAARISGSFAVSSPAAVTSDRVNAQFAVLAASLPVCVKDQVTNCRYGTAATHLEASVQSPTATTYFEMRGGVVTVLEVYPIH